MNRRDRRRTQSLWAKGALVVGARCARTARPQKRVVRGRSGAAGRNALLLGARRELLLGTALASTLLFSTMLAPTPAAAVVTCAAFDGTGPAPILLPGTNDSIDCVNTEARTGVPYAVQLSTIADNQSIELNTIGTLTASGAGEAFGIFAETDGANSGIIIDNAGDVISTGDAGLSNDAYAIYARANGAGSNITIDNTGDLAATAVGDTSTASGIYAFSAGVNNDITIHNAGDITAVTGGDDSTAYGIYAGTFLANADVTIHNSGDIVAASNGDLSDAYGIFAETDLENANVTIDNSGAIAVTSVAGRFAHGIRVSTYGADSDVSIDNAGDITAINASEADVSYAFGLRTYTADLSSDTKIVNSGDISASTNGELGGAFGIAALADAGNSNITIHNTGGITATTSGYSSAAYGIFAQTNVENSSIAIHNSGDFRVETGGDFAYAYGISALTLNVNSPLELHNTGDFRVKTGGDEAVAYGINAFTADGNSPLELYNSGDFRVKTSGDGSDAYGIRVFTSDDNSPLELRNKGDLTVETGGPNSKAYGIGATTDGANSPITIANTGDIAAETTGAGGYASGILASTLQDNSAIIIDNTGDITAAATDENADGILASTFNSNSSTIAIRNGGDIDANSIGNDAFGIRTTTNGPDSDITIENAGGITATAGGDAAGISAFTFDLNSPITIRNSGDITATAIDGDADGILAIAFNTNSPITIKNSGDIEARAGGYSYGINAIAFNPDSPIRIENAGGVFGDTAGIRTFSPNDANPTTIRNTGTVGAESHRAIDVKGAGTAHIDNTGTITGFVDLTEQDDVFNNRSGGVFEAKKTSFFGAGDDLFDNRSGGTVQAATSANRSEMTFFEGLETFKNAGTISMVDGKEGDTFTIANTPGGTDLKYRGQGGTLAVDTFLGGAGSTSDIFTVQGDVSGTTFLAVNNTNAGPGVFNSKGIPVVFVDGATPSADNFQLQSPIDTGFFDYDLFFEPTGSGFWELRSFAGGGAHLLPQLLTAAQDIWHESSSTWFDRTADLRVLLHGGPAPVATGDKSLAIPGQTKFTPAVWAKGSISQLDRDANVSTRAYGRNYNFNLDRDLDTFDVQVGVDMAARDVLGSGDALVFGVLGGFIHGDLSYDSLARNFDYSGGQVGAYATYLSGGLFVDTLFNAHIYELDADNVAFPGSVDGNTIGLRTDAGYRFGSFTGGAFLEPLGTIEVMWADLDGFSVGGNRVSFSDEANVRGRLGLRAGTTSEVWEGTLMEPFIVGSVWGNLDDSNAATLVSAGRTFQFQDNPEDVWGEVEAGVNFFNFSQTTSVFGKVDVTFGDDISGVGGKAGMRLVW